MGLTVSVYSLLKKKKSPLLKKLITQHTTVTITKRMMFRKSGLVIFCSQTRLPVVGLGCIQLNCWLRKSCFECLNNSV